MSYEVRIFKDVKNWAGMVIDLGIGEGASFRSFTISTQAKGNDGQPATSASRSSSAGLPGFQWPYYNYSTFQWPSFPTGVKAYYVPTSNIGYQGIPFSFSQLKGISLIVPYPLSGNQTWNVLSSAYVTSNIYRPYSTSFPAYSYLPGAYKNW